MIIKHEGFRLFVLCCIMILVCVACVPFVNPNSYSAVSTASPSFAWSATPDINATVDDVLSVTPPPESNAVWTSTPGWLTPPAPTFTPSESPTATIIFDTPKPGQVQGVRGTVLVSGGPAPENGLIPTPRPSCCITIFARDLATDQVMAETQSGAYGIYELQLLPGRYNICTSAGYGTDYCTNNVIITAGNFLTIDFGVAMP